MLDDCFIERIASEVSVRPEQVAATVRLLDGGATIPFVARYRKDVVGSLDEAQIETIAERNSYYIGVVNRRRNILDACTKAGVLTDELRAKIDACYDKSVLEDLYLPFKPKRRTKASAAEDQGLAPLADFLLQQLPGLQAIEEFASAFVKPEKSVSSPEEAFEGACYIIAERIAADPEARIFLRNRMAEAGVLSARATKNAEGSKTKFEAYYNFSEPLNKIPSHRMLALLRGAKEGVLRVDISIDDEAALNDLASRYIREPAFAAILRPAIAEAYTRHLRPAIESEEMEEARKRAEDEAIRVCRENVAGILLTPSAGAINVIGVVVSPKKGCRFSVVNGMGQLLENVTVAFVADVDLAESCAEPLRALMQKHDAYAIAIANGPGAREIAKVINGVLGDVRDKGAFTVLLSPSPAVACASTRQAKEEHPELDAESLQSLSIARRLQNPLAELVKAEPRSIGTGQYQHDVNQKHLRESLHRTVASCVNRVGVDLNTASVEMLRYVSGLQPSVAENIVAKRVALGGFTTREQLREVEGVGPKVFEQCVGFLKIPNAAQPLDATAIHPEIYPLVERLVHSVTDDVAGLIANAELIDKVDFAAFETEAFGPLTLADVRMQLLSPGYDVRGVFNAPRFLEGVSSVNDLNEGMEIEGVVTNVTDFGAFVNIGVQQDGLVHLSELSTRFVKDPREVIKVGDVVKVRVIKVDKETPRISLSMKAAQPPRARRPEGTRPARRRPEAAPQVAPAGEGGVATLDATQSAAPTEETRRPARRRPDGAQGRPAGGESDDRRAGRPRRPEKTGRDRSEGHDRDRRPSDKSARGNRESSPRPTAFGDTGALVNTLLADQLAILKKKIGS